MGINKEMSMTTNVTLNDSISDSTNMSQSDFIENLYKKSREEELKFEYKKMVKHTTITMKTLANAYYKDCAFLETSDIEHIKTSLNNYMNNNVKVSKFKNTIIEDLNKFQNKIQENHTYKLKSLKKEKTFCEKQVKVLYFAKDKLILYRLFKFQWPYDSKIQEYENKIAVLKIKIGKCQQKIEELQKKRPAANAKDILIYQMQLKENYSG